MLKFIIATTFMILGATASVQAVARDLPRNIESSYLCTKFGIHGETGTAEYVNLAGEYGNFDPVNPYAREAIGYLSRIVYDAASSTVTGLFSSDAQSGWFRWAFYDETGFYGSCGLGTQVAEQEQGFWSGALCAP